MDHKQSVTLFYLPKNNNNNNNKTVLHTRWYDCRFLRDFKILCLNFQDVFGKWNPIWTIVFLCWRFNVNVLQDRLIEFQLFTKTKRQRGSVVFIFVVIFLTSLSVTGKPVVLKHIVSVDMVLWHILFIVTYFKQWFIYLCITWLTVSFIS